MSHKKSVCSVDDFWMTFHHVNLVCRNWKKKAEVHVTVLLSSGRTATVLLLLTKENCVRRWTTWVKESETEKEHVPNPNPTSSTLLCTSCKYCTFLILVYLVYSVLSDFVCACALNMLTRVLSVLTCVQPLQVPLIAPQVQEKLFELKIKYSKTVRCIAVGLLKMLKMSYKWNAFEVRKILHLNMQQYRQLKVKTFSTDFQQKGQAQRWERNFSMQIPF